MDLKATSLVTVLLLCSCSDDDAKSGKPVNHPCETNSDCADSICHSGVCASPSPNANGASCKGAGECKSFRCVGYKCVAGEKKGDEECINHEECLSGVCSSSKCKGGPTPDAGPDAAPPDQGKQDTVKPQPDQGKPDAPLPDKATPDQAKPDLPQPDLHPPDLPGPDASLCGNGKLDPGETCDKTVPPSTTCAGGGFDDGVVTCHANCKLNFTGCHQVKDKGGNNVSSTYKAVHARVATDGTDFLVAWKNMNDLKVYAARVSAAGKPTGSPILLGTTYTAGYSTHVAVGYGGGNYLVAWDGGGAPSWLTAARVTPQGKVLDTMGITVAKSHGSNPDIVFDGTNFLLVWYHKNSKSQNTIYAARLSTSGKVLDAPVQVNQSAGQSARDPVVAFDGTNHLVVYETYGGSIQGLDISANRLNTSLKVLDKTDIVVAKALNDQWRPDVVFGKTNYLVVWDDRRKGTASTFVAGARVSKAGMLLDPKGLLVSNCALAKSPAVGHDGLHFFVAWYGCILPKTSAERVLGRRLNAQGYGVGNVFDLAGGTPAYSKLEPAMSYAAGQYLVAWRDLRNYTSDPRIYATRVKFGTP